MRPEFEFVLEEKKMDDSFWASVKSFFTKNVEYTLGQCWTRHFPDGTNQAVRVRVFLGSVRKTACSHYFECFINMMIRKISKVIGHEYLHSVFKDFNLTPEQQHWATERLGFGGELL